MWYSLKGKREQVQVVSTVETTLSFISLFDFHTSYKYAGESSYLVFKQNNFAYN
jgi:hypothetical protein